MHRGLTGVYVPGIAGGHPCQAFVPAPLPPDPPLAFNDKLQARINEAMLALGRLDAISTLLPDARLFLYSYVRKEAVMSSQIEGTQSSLSDLMLFEMEAQPGVPMDDVREVSCYVNALDLGVRRLREGLPLSRRLLCEVHEALMTSGRGVQRSPGQFRRNQVWIGGHRADEAQFVPPPGALDDCFGALERFLNDNDSTTTPVIQAALAHVQFETIHPFMDGNGRLGRLLIPLVMVEAERLYRRRLSSKPTRRYPVQSRNARAKLFSLSNPTAAATCFTGLCDCSSSLIARSRRASFFRRCSDTPSSLNWRCSVRTGILS